MASVVSIDRRGPPSLTASRVRSVRVASTTRVATPVLMGLRVHLAGERDALARFSRLGPPSGGSVSRDGDPSGAFGRARGAEPPAGSPADDTAGVEQLLQLVDGLLNSVASGRLRWNRGPFGGCP